MKYLNQLDNFTRGEWEGQSVYDVADEDPGYLQRLLDNGPIDAEDRTLLRSALGLPEDE
jgi:hypothetical protein